MIYIILKKYEKFHKIRNINWKFTKKINMIINLLLIIPIIGSIVIGLIPVSEISEKDAEFLIKNNKIKDNGIINKEEIESYLKQENNKRTRNLQIIGLSFAIINFIVSLYIWVVFDSNINQYQFVYNFDSLSFCHFNLGIDGISLYFVLLTTFLTPVALLANFGNLTKNIKYLAFRLRGLENLTNGIESRNNING